MLRRLSQSQPAGFAFTDANRAWAEAEMTKYPEGRQASAIIPILWRAQEQEGWLSRPAIEHVADLVGVAYIRALEVATFYFMFQLERVGDVAHVQVCGTTSCMIMGSDALIDACKRHIAPRPFVRSADGALSWEEVECLGACANAPMAQIGKDYYEDLTPERFEAILSDLREGRVPVPGPQDGRFASEPASGLTSLKPEEGARDLAAHNYSVQAAIDLGDTVKRIDGTEMPLVTAWRPREGDDGVPPERGEDDRADAHAPRPGAGHPIDRTGVTEHEAVATTAAKPEASGPAPDKGTPGPKNAVPDAKEAAGADPHGVPQDGGDARKPG